MSERPKHRAQTAISRKRRPWFHDFGRTLNATDSLTALARAWTVTTIATALLLAALALAPVWDTGVFLKALTDGLSDPQLTQSIDPAPARSPMRKAVPIGGQ